MNEPRSRFRPHLLANVLGIVPRHPTARFMDAASLDQQAFRGRNDDGSETTATWKANQNTNWTQAVDENFRVRFEIQEEAGIATSGSLNAIKLQYNLGGAGWNDVNASSSVVRSSASPNVADDAATTNQLTSGTGTFNPGKFDEVDGAISLAANTPASGHTEVEFCVQIRSADVAHNDTVQLRVVTGAGVLNTYTATPSITVSEETGVTGALTKTLDDATLDADGQVDVEGTLDKALDAVALDADGTVAVDGALDRTLDPVALSATGGAPIVTGTLDKTLDGITLDADGAVEIAGQLTKTLDDVGLDAAGVAPIAGSLELEIDALLADLLGEVAIVGSSAVQLSDAVLVAAGEGPGGGEPPETHAIFIPTYRRRRR